MDKKEYSLKAFSYYGNDNVFSGMLDYLIGIAEDEKWTVSKEKDVIRYYIFYTFERCNEQNKIVYSEDGCFCCTNTGLLDKYGNDIMMVFDKNTHYKGSEDPYWHLKGFKKANERDYMDHFNEIPKLASYTDSYEDYYFNPNYHIEINTEHILDDNWERIYQEVGLEKKVVSTLLIGVIEETKKRVKRNTRLAVPQYYNNKIMYLLPISIPVNDSNNVTMALAIERTNGQYRANTIFTRDTAYKKARLLMKPESNWLIE